MDNSITQGKRQQLKKKFNESKKPIEAMLKQYKYQEDIPHAENMKKLCICLENVMNVDCIDDFAKFLSNEQQLPIQVNFKALRYEYLTQMFDDWLASKQQNSFNGDINLPHKHRNILFKRIFLQQKQTIKDYFRTLSPKIKLKGIDLFQLITQLLSPFYLYQFNNDTQTFFQKINSFNHFIQVVESFVVNARRSYAKDKQDLNDQMYIRLHQFQYLIQYWQNINTELTIQQIPRKNMKDVFVQTNSGNVASEQTQTQKESSRSYLNILNNTLYQINLLISKQNDPELLASLDIVFDALRSQKLFAVTYQSKKNQKRLLNNANKFAKKSPTKLISSEQCSETQRIVLFDKPKSLNSPPKNKSPRKISMNNGLTHQKVVINSPRQNQQDQVKVIYRFLCSKDSLHSLTLNQLQIFFYNLGLTQAHQNHLVHNLLNYGFIQDKDEISLKQFKNILRELMKQNKSFTMNSLKIFINTFIQIESMAKTAYFKNNSPRNNNVFIRSDFTNFSGKKSHQPQRAERLGQISSKTTYQIDSDGSNF